MKGVLAAGACAAAFALPACGSEESGYAPVPARGEPAFEGPARGNARIAMREIEYRPRNVKLTRGAVVTWVNRDRVAHTVTQGNTIYHDFDSSDVAPGQSYRRTFDEPGEVRYRCTIHANMEGVLRVVE